VSKGPRANSLSHALNEAVLISNQDTTDFIKRLANAKRAALEGDGAESTVRHGWEQLRYFNALVMSLCHA
jgi:hypothetical protein